MGRRKEPPREVAKVCLLPAQSPRKQELVFLNKLCRKNSKNLAHYVARYVMRAATPEDDATVLINRHGHSQELAQTRPRKGIGEAERLVQASYVLCHKNGLFLALYITLHSDSRLGGSKSGEN